ncbi:MAG: alpha/beta hydrolase [Bacteroidota bacterium]
MPILNTILIIVAVAYVLLCLVFYFGQDLFFFRPEILPSTFRYQYPFPFDEVNFDMEDGGTINGLHFKVPNARGVVFYVKGNSRSIKGWGKFARDFVSKGYDFFMIDYRGFGKSRGRRTESIMYNDLQHIYKWLAKKYPEEKIIIYGRSMGSGFATRIASWNNPRMLILDSPYYSFFHQVQRYGFWLPIRWLLRYQIRTDQFIRKVTCPVFIIHGKKDRLIPYKFGEMLHEQIPTQSMLFPIEEGGHNNLPDFPEYHDQLYDILNDDGFYRRMLSRFKARA